MYWKIAGVLAPILAVGAIGAGMWGYQENQEKNSVLIKAENQYQRAFHNLNYHIDKLQDELGKTIAVNSRQQLTPCLTNVWRLAYSAQNDVGQLPLTLLPFNQTQKFLANVADFSYQTAVRDLEKKPLSDKEYKTLQALYRHSQEIQSQLQKVQTAVIDKHLRWMDVESALATEEKQEDNTIIDGLKVVDKSVGGYKDVDFGSGIGSLNAARKLKIQSIKGTPVTAEEAKKRALAFVNITPAQLAEATVVDNGSGRDYESFSVRIVRKGDPTPVHVDVAKKGGKVVWVLDERDVTAKKLKIEEAKQKADRYLAERGYRSMEAVSYGQYEGLAVFTYVYKQGDIRIYPDTVTVKVALDKGDVLGFQGESYLLNHRPRTLAKPGLTEAQARAKVNPGLKVKEARLAVIENESGQEVQAYEFYGGLGQDRYRVYIDASTGEEVKIEKIKAIAL
ncbi:MULTISPECIES: germination protein YpeB [Aneurinibacillus]|uniref:Germination protein YpeB n=1 Tax=Aneurinibacillus thermoaerophilus TaxID=143495 RepID=A0A1G7XJ46_ANETH|nr:MULTISPECIES: germination protein YpeB [Aneurinibacillus]AMA73598.1 germination protein YpeB [Aneurinibacillus sp. XH2]MED0674991.1 germination protein YpeB [Aneurinibacillus thermoaerophilus]MED0679608.1 germination protein YpeB [Aneurinibacillus thermoaerophilus]MED0737394.1 germination protein YpeB [Aneurinibacillus thermoaerophilus]MED0756243.1 germination protein YpeB [Aneurinibacillus thermoaerophilus]